MNWILIVGIACIACIIISIFIWAPILIFKFGLDYDLSGYLNLTLIIISVILIIISIAFLLIYLALKNNTERQSRIENESFGGMFGFSRKSLLGAAAAAAARLIGDRENTIKSEEICELIKNFRNSRDRFDLSKYYSVSNHTDINNYDNNVSVLKKERTISKYVRNTPLYIRNSDDDRGQLQYDLNQLNLPKEGDYDFMTIVAKTKDESATFASLSIGHYITLILRKRNNIINIYLLDPKREDSNPKRTSDIQGAFRIFFMGHGIIFHQKQCSIQDSNDGINCGLFSFKLIYNYLLLSRDGNDNIDVINSICPGTDRIPARTIAAVALDRFGKFAWGTGGESVEIDPKTYFKEMEYENGIMVPTDNYYYLSKEDQKYIRDKMEEKRRRDKEEFERYEAEEKARELRELSANSYDPKKSSDDI